MSASEIPGPAAGPWEGSAHMRYREAARVTWAGAIVNVVLAAAKLVAGVLGQSQALIADGVHSLSDLASDALVLVAARHSSREADEEHPYGHGRIETAVTVGLGVLLAAVAGGIMIDAVHRLYEPNELLHPGVLALMVAVASIASKEGLYHYTLRTAHRLRSPMLRANAWHHRSDAVSSIIVMIGIIGSMAGLPYLDALAAVGVAVMIAKIGWDLGWHSIRELVDTALDRDRVEAIRRAILAADGVRALHALRTRRMGSDALVDVHIQVDSTLSVSEGHHIGEQVRAKLIEEIDEVYDVTVHVDPEDDEMARATQALPPRKAVLDRLNQRFRDIEAARHIQRVTLHYLDGKIRVDLQLPLDLIDTRKDAYALMRRFQDAVREDPDIGAVRLQFYG